MVATVGPLSSKNKVALQLNNNYDPFMRTQNPAFTMRKRSHSVNCVPVAPSLMQSAAVRRRRPSFLAIPRLETIEEIDFGDDLESIFN